MALLLSFISDSSGEARLFRQSADACGRMKRLGEMLFGAHQAEAVAGRRNSHARRASEPAHRLVAEENVAEEALDTFVGGAAGQARQQQAANALPLPVVGDGDREFRL